MTVWSTDKNEEVELELEMGNDDRLDTRRSTALTHLCSTDAVFGSVDRWTTRVR